MIWAKVLPTTASDTESIAQAGIIAPDRAGLLQTDGTVGNASVLHAYAAVLVVVLMVTPTTTHRSIIKQVFFTATSHPIRSRRGGSSGGHR